MEDKNIKDYNENDAFYSGTDEEYEEFLKTVDGKINSASPVTNDSVDDLGATKAINLQGVIEKFRKTADGIMDVSKKFTAGAVSKIEDFKKSKETDSEAKEESANAPVNADACKEEVAPAIMQSIDNEKLDGVFAKLNEVSELLKDIELYSRNGSSYAENALLQIKSVSNGVEEIRQAVSGINKLSDSIFDLKNAQLNTKNSMENLEVGFLSLKKKCVMGITVISILTLLSIVLSILILLS